MTEWNQEDPTERRDQSAVEETGAGTSSEEFAQEARFCFGVAIFSWCCTTISFFLWGITRSSYIHEGGDPSDVFQGPFITTIFFFLLAVFSVALGFRASAKADR